MIQTYNNGLVQINNLIKVFTFFFKTPQTKRIKHECPSFTYVLLLNYKCSITTPLNTCIVIETTKISEIMVEKLSVHNEIDKNFSKYKHFFPDELWQEPTICIKFNDIFLNIITTYASNIKIYYALIDQVLVCKYIFDDWIDWKTVINSYWFQHYLKKYNTKIDNYAVELFEQFIPLKLIKIYHQKEEILLLMTIKNYFQFLKQLNDKCTQVIIKKSVKCQQILQLSSLFNKTKLIAIFKSERFINVQYFPYFMQWNDELHFKEKNLPEMDLLFKMIIRNLIIEYISTKKYVNNLINNYSGNMCKDEKNKLSSIIHWSQYPQYNNDKQLVLGCLVNSALFSKCMNAKEVIIKIPDNHFDFNVMTKGPMPDWISNNCIFNGILNIIWYGVKTQIKQNFTLQSVNVSAKMSTICIINDNNSYTFCHLNTFNRKQEDITYTYVKTRYELLYIVGNLSVDILKHKNFDEQMVAQYQTEVNSLYFRIGEIFLNLFSKIH